VSLNALISTSVSDAKITLEGQLASNPYYTARMAIDLLEIIQKHEGQASRRKMAAAIVRKAAKAMEGGEA
jgi:hypothetical protein